MLPVNRQSILEKYYMQTFYKRSWDIVKRFDNVLKTLPNKCYYTLFIRPLKNVMKMLCVCWVIRYRRIFLEKWDGNKGNKAGKYRFLAWFGEFKMRFCEIIDEHYKKYVWAAVRGAPSGINNRSCPDKHQPNRSCPHVNQITARANKTLGFVKRNLWFTSKEIKAETYRTLIRPTLEYASSAWDPYRPTCNLTSRSWSRFREEQQGLQWGIRGTVASQQCYKLCSVTRSKTEGKHGLPCCTRFRTGWCASTRTQTGP